MEEERIAYFDNAKLILIFLVVLGHVIQAASPNNPTLRSLFTVIYFFHMPAFALISGYFSKDISKIPKQIVKFTVYYLIFELLFFPLCRSDGIIYIFPYFTMWFLVSLISWNLLLLVFSKINRCIFYAVIIGVLIGYIGSIGWTLSLSRTFVFFPFFLIGYGLQAKNFIQKFSPIIKTSSAVIITTIFFLIYLLPYKIPYEWLYGSMGYLALNSAEWYAGFYRLGVYAVGALLCLCFFVLVPKNRWKLTYMGQKTMQTFLLHGFIIYWLHRQSFYPSLNIISLFVIAMLITMVLSSNAISTVYKCCTDLLTKAQNLIFKSLRRHYTVLISRRY